LFSLVKRINVTGLFANILNGVISKSEKISKKRDLRGRTFLDCSKILE